jgi:hypothetical protein
MPAQELEPMARIKDFLENLSGTKGDEYVKKLLIWHEVVNMSCLVKQIIPPPLAQHIAHIEVAALMVEPMGLDKQDCKTLLKLERDDMGDLVAAFEKHHGPMH